jgi:hypothetical protein
MKMYLTALLLLIPTANAGDLTEKDYNAKQGMAEFNKGDYAAASHYWAKCAKAGQLVCMNNLGMVQYKAGHKDLGLGWINAAASKGHKGAIKNLHDFGLPIPAQESTSEGPSTIDALLGLANAGLEGYNQNARETVNCTTYDLGGIYNTRCK